MPGHTRLYRRGATYYHRAAVPVDIKESYPKTEETFSLKTKDYQEALKRVRKEAVRVDKLFEDHRRKHTLATEPALTDLSEEQVDAVRTAFLRQLLLDDENMRLKGFRSQSFEQWEEGAEFDDVIYRFHYAQGQQAPWEDDQIASLLAESEIDLNVEVGSMGWAKIYRAMQEAGIEAVNKIKLRNMGEIIDTPANPQLANPQKQINGAREVSVTPMLSEVVEKWLAEKTRTSWVPKTAKDHRTWSSHFIAIAGDRPLSQYSKTDGRAFKQVLLSLPPNWNKQRQLAGLDIEDASSHASELGMAPMSDKNVNKIIGYVQAFWNWASSNYDDCPPNPLKGLHVSISKKTVRDERHPFTAPELQSIFSAPVFTGCESATHWQTPGPTILRDKGKYWVPLIALFTGARAGEIIQLQVEDIKNIDNIWFFDINENSEDKQLKTAASTRKIPIHNVLNELGFLDFVNRCMARKQQRLFPEMKKGADGYYSSPYSKHFSRFLRSIGVKTRLNAFHSFRHNFEDACRNSGLSKEVMDALQGHREQGMAGRYGKGFDVKTLAEAIKRLHYDGLDLSHLIEKGA